MSDDKFARDKNKAMASLTQALDSGDVDGKIIPILKIINSLPGYYTTSSCAGRIMVLEIPSAGEKKEARTLGKWHHKIHLQKLKDCFHQARRGEIWFLVQSPIFHVGVESMEKTSPLLRIAIVNGFKNSGIKTQGKKIIIEITSTERVNTPLGMDGKVMCSDEYLKLLVQVANHAIERSDKKIDRLNTNLFQLHI